MEEDMIKSVVGVFAAAVLASSVAVAPSSAADGPLEVRPGTQTVRVLNVGARIDADGALAQRLADVAYGVRTDADVYKLRLVFESYAAPQGVSIGATEAKLAYVQDGDTKVGVPTASWSWLTARTVSGTSDDSDDQGRVRLEPTGDPIYLTAKYPGTYRVRLVDPGRDGGEDDDTVSAPLDLVVLDVQGVTGSALTDDWRPGITAPRVAGVAKALPVAVDLSGVAAKDQRGSTGGVGVLGQRVADLVGVKWSAPGALGWDLGTAGVPVFTDYGCFGSCPWRKPGGLAVTAAGAAVLPASTDGVDTLRHIGAVTSTAVLDRDGAGLAGAGPVVGEPVSEAVTQVVATVPGIVTMSVSPTGCVGACVVTASGTAEGAATVKVGGVTAPVDPLTGEWAARIGLSKTTRLQAVTAGGASDPVTVPVQSIITKLSGKGVGGGKVVVDVTGGPRLGGLAVVTVAGRTARCRVPGMTGDAGVGTCRVTVTGVRAGTRTVSATYDTAKTTRSEARTVKVTVS